jgi:hypothetical protein
MAKKALLLLSGIIILYLIIYQEETIKWVSPKPKVYIQIENNLPLDQIYRFEINGGTMLNFSVIGSPKPCRKSFNLISKDSVIKLHTKHRGVFLGELYDFYLINSSNEYCLEYKSRYSLSLID